VPTARESWQGKSAKEIMGGVRAVVGEDRFDVFRAHSGEFRRGEIDGSQVGCGGLWTCVGGRGRAGGGGVGEVGQEARDGLCPFMLPCMRWGVEWAILSV